MPSSFVPAIAAVILSAGAYFVSTGLNTFWPLGWIAPLPILLLAFTRSWRATAPAALAAYLLGSLNLVPILSQVVPPPVMVLLLLLPAAAFAATVLAARYVARRAPAAVAALGFPLAWTTYEFLLSRYSPHGTVMSLAYSQTDALPLLQLASLTGIWGMTFVLTLVPSAVAAAWARRSAAALLPAIVIGGATLGYGTWRLAQPRGGPVVRVGLAAEDGALGLWTGTEDPAVALPVVRAYADRIDRLAAAGAQVVVLPEKFVGVAPQYSAEVFRLLSEAARRGHVTVVAGLNRNGAMPLHNVALVFGPDGAVLGEYEKHHLVPVIEGEFASGSTVVTFAGPGGPWATAICKDLDFPQWLRRYGQNGVRLLAVPAWDFVVDARMHSRPAVVRAVENGFTLARVAVHGLLTFSDAYGRILAEQPSDQRPDSVLVIDLPAGPGPTFYTRAGDWFGWTSVAGLALLLAASSRLKPRAA